MKRTSRTTKKAKEPDGHSTKVVGIKRAGLRAGKNFEPNLAIGAITSTEFLREMKEEVEENLQYIQSPDIKQILLWCFEYYEKYGKAPHLNIQDLFEDKRDLLNPADEDIIEVFLSNLSRKYSEMEGFQAEFEVDFVRRELQKARVEEQAREILKLLREDDLEGADELVTGLTSQLQTTGGLLSAFESCLMTDKEFIAAEIPKPRSIIHPWLTAGSITQVYAPRGVGKTWFSLIVSVAATRKNFEDCDIGHWHTERPSGVLYLDAEMGQFALQDRVNKLTYSLGETYKAIPLLIFSADRFSNLSNEHSGNINIAKKEWRNIIYKYFEGHKKMKVLILDNLAALTPGIDENSSQEWGPIGRWLVSLRHLGISTIFVHHTGKGGDQRGTSAREDSIDCSIKLSLPEGYKPEEGCRFNVEFMKARNVGPGANLTPFNISLVEIDEHKHLAWQTSEVRGRKADRRVVAMALIIDGSRTGEIAEQTGLSTSRVSQIKKDMREKKGWLDDDGRATFKGREWRKGIDLDMYLED